MVKRDIAITIQNYVQFVNVRAGIDELMNMGYSVDIYCPESHDKQGYGSMYDDIRKYLKTNGYKVFNKVQDYEYKVLLEPYPFLNITAKYYIKYRYGCISAKPSLVYSPYNFVKYDAILCSGSYDSNYLSAFSKTYQTGNMKYIGFKKKKKNSKGKKNLIYLPTYGDGCSIDLIIEELNKLREKYYVIVKIHHGTNFLNNEQNRINKLRDCVDEYYDSHKNLSELLEIADVVLTDNSGALFEALYTDTPVAIFCDDVNKHKIGNFNTIQYELVEKGIIPYTNNKNQLNKILDMALSKQYIEKQNNWNKRSFYHPKDLKKDFVELIVKFLRDEIDNRYYEMHHLLKKEYYEMHDTIISKDKIIEDINQNISELNSSILNLENKNELVNNKLQEKNFVISNLEVENSRLEKALSYYENGKLYKIAKKIYKLFRKGV